MNKKMFVVMISIVVVFFLAAQTCQMQGVTSGIASDCIGEGDIVCDGTEAYQCQLAQFGVGYYVSRASGYDISDCGAEDTTDTETDTDGDGVLDDSDACEGYDDTIDTDSDGTPDGCDDDIDGDGFDNNSEESAGTDVTDASDYPKETSVDCTLLPATVAVGTGNIFEVSATSTGTIASYYWEFGDGFTSSTTTSTTLYGYIFGGTYTITVTVTDDAGVTDSCSQGVIVTCTAEPDCSPSDFCDTATSMCIARDDDLDEDGLSNYIEDTVGLNYNDASDLSSYKVLDFNTVDWKAEYMNRASPSATTPPYLVDYLKDTTGVYSDANATGYVSYDPSSGRGVMFNNSMQPYISFVNIPDVEQWIIIKSKLEASSLMRSGVGRYPIVVRVDPSATGPSSLQYVMDIHRGNYTFGLDFSGTHITLDSGSLSSGLKEEVVGVYYNNYIYLFVDNELKDSYDASSLTLSSPTLFTDFYVGGNGVDPLITSFSGDIDFVEIWGD